MPNQVEVCIDFYFMLKVLAVQAIRPESLVSVMETFVQRALHLKELSPPALSLKNIYMESINSVPILIIISSGSDPSEVKQNGFLYSLKSITLSLF